GYASGVIARSWADTIVSGDPTVGGLAGFLHLGQIENAYALGTVASKGYAGGLIGGAFDQNAVLWAYAAAIVTGADGESGGFAGNTPYSVTASYWNKDVAGQPRGIGDAVSDPIGLTAFSSALMT